jgi:hypothetical protein
MNTLDIGKNTLGNTNSCDFQSVIPTNNNIDMLFHEDIYLHWNGRLHFDKILQFFFWVGEMKEIYIHKNQTKVVNFLSFNLSLWNVLNYNSTLKVINTTKVFF